MIVNIKYNNALICVWKFTFYNKYIVNREEKFSPLQMADHSRGWSRKLREDFSAFRTSCDSDCQSDLLQRCRQNLAEAGQASEALYQAQF